MIGTRYHQPPPWAEAPHRDMNAVQYRGGRVSWCPYLGLFSATIPAGIWRNKRMRWLGYWRSAGQAERAIREFEAAAGLQSKPKIVAGRRTPRTRLRSPSRPL
jgi:hypothetical protein